MRYPLTLAVIVLAASAAAAEPIAPKDIRVIDGDTIHARGQSYRLVGFDTPETDNARCPAELQLGDRAKARLQAIVNLGNLDLAEVVCSCRPATLGTRRCNHGRLCATLASKGEDVGDILIRERLARPYHCGKHSCPRRASWCR